MGESTKHFPTWAQALNPDFVDYCYDRDNRLRSRTLSIVGEVGSDLYLNKQNASDEVLSVLE